MRKNIKRSVRTLAIAIVGMGVTACNLDGYEPEKPFTTCPTGPAVLAVYGVSPTESRSTASYAQGALFTEDDIEWFDPVTRELRFRNHAKALHERTPMPSEVHFCLDGELLFTGSVFLSIACSIVFDDLVLCQGCIDGNHVESDGYYLYDCYPPQYASEERVQANIQRRAPQWDAFIRHLASRGKIRQE